MTRHLSWISAVLLLGGMILLSGCGNNPLGRKSITGTVTLDDRPLDQGTIAFEPQGRGKGAVGSGATIEDGSFSIPAEKGLPVGNYVVRIYSSVEKNAGQAGNQDSDALGGGHGGGVERIPPKYNLNTELDAEVTDDKACVLQYDLKSR